MYTYSLEDTYLQAYIVKHKIALYCYPLSIFIFYNDEICDLMSVDLSWFYL